MERRRIMTRNSSYVILGVLLALLLGVGVSGAEGVEPLEELDLVGDSGLNNGLLAEGEVWLAATISQKISYQGVLKEDGNPVTGDRNMTFKFYSDDSCTNLVQSVGPISVSVSDGLFSTEVSVDQSNFDGQGLWLEVEVGSTTIGCREILPVPYALSLRPDADVVGDVSGKSVVYVKNTATTGESRGIGATTDSSTEDSAGVYGYASASSGETYGVRGVSDSPAGRGVYGKAPKRGVYGYASETSDTAYGVYGSTPSSNGRGVRGFAFSPSGTTYGVSGESISPDGAGVYGLASWPSGVTFGVYGKVNSTTDSARGVYGYATGTTGITYGVYGESDSSTGIGVAGLGEAMGVFGVCDKLGVVGASTATSGVAYGVQGQVDSITDDSRGVYGYATGTSGKVYGVYGLSDSSSAETAGVYGKATAHSTFGPAATYGVYGETASGSSDAAGVYGYASADDGVYNAGVYGINDTTYNGYGVYGETSASSGEGYGVYGRSKSTAAVSAGVYGKGKTRGVWGVSVDGVGVRAESTDGNPLEAWNTFPNNRVFYVGNYGSVYADGTYYGAGGVTAGSADFAEMMLPGQADLVPGDVLAIGQNGEMVRSTEAYQPTVVGVYSTDPGFVAGNKLDEDGNSVEPERIPLAVLGVVPVKACTENGPVQPGDLLVASSTPGHAMKADEHPPTGTVIGKALEGLGEDIGTIQMMVMLQ
jgi:hypothetical protein